MAPPLLFVLKSRLSLPPSETPPPPDLISAAVLVPLFFQEDQAQLLFTQRTFTLKDHRGQISFPGGVRHKKDPELLTTALRETWEEVGLDAREVEVLGALPPVDTITGYRITPFVGLIPFPYDFQPNPLEVKRLLFLPFEGFYPADRWTSSIYHHKMRTTRVCSWSLNREVIWGATARILLSLLALVDVHPIPGDKDATCLD